MRTKGTTLNYIYTEGVKLLLGQPDTTTRNGRRHLVILSLMYDTGARVQEIAVLTVVYVRVSHEPYTIRLYGKDRKARVAPPVKEQVSLLRAYLEENDLDDNAKGSSTLFFNSRHEIMTRKGIAYILAIYAEQARKASPELIPERISCHSLRYPNLFCFILLICSIILKRFGFSFILSIGYRSPHRDRRILSCLFHFFDSFVWFSSSRVANVPRLSEEDKAFATLSLCPLQ